MRCYWFPALLFAAGALAETVGYWTLHNFQMICDAGPCVYHFSVSEDDGSTPGVPCLFTVDGKDGKPADQTDFQAVDCLDLSQYRVNGGWSDQGFITIVVADPGESVNAFFAYSRAQLANGSMVEEQTRLAYKIGTFDISNHVVVPVKRSGLEWQVLNLNQDYDEMTGNTELTFAIQDVSGTMDPCTIITKGADASETAVGSFYNEKCIESNWFISWERSAVTDTAVLSVVEPNTMLKAWFQWENVSLSHSLGNSVRSIASPCEDETL